jgi:hypothetical protein|tara:strand:- start:2627 stop:3076 length:450 start_codon:yes stop_codon:yes gene_type:complete
MKYKIVPFKAEHWDMIEFREFEQETMGKLLDQVRLRVNDSGPTYTGFVDGKVAGFAGVILMWPGVGEGWILGSDLFASNKLWFIRNVKRYLEKIMKTHEMHRVQTTVLHGQTELIRLVEFLGMKFEGRLRNYGPNGEDYLMYGRISWHQ